MTDIPPHIQRQITDIIINAIEAAVICMLSVKHNRMTIPGTSPGISAIDTIKDLKNTTQAILTASDR